MHNLPARIDALSVDRTRAPYARSIARLELFPWAQVGTGIAVGGAAAFAILFGGMEAIALLLALGGGIALSMMAYNRPTTTIALWALLTVHLREVVVVRDIAVVGGIDAMPSDPILLGIAVASIGKIAVGDPRAREVLKGTCLFLTLFLVWLGFELVRSVPGSGIVSAIGELRRTFQPLFVVPYICIFFRTRPQQIRLLRALAVLALLLIPIALWEGALRDFAISSKTRWLVAQSNLALVFGATALFVLRRHGIDGRQAALYTALLTGALVVTIACNHRSVWMSAAGATLALVAFHQLRSGTLVRLLAITAVAVAVLDVLYSGLDVVEFLRVRLLAFTAYEADPTANWRSEVWRAALQEAKTRWLFGKGFGTYFSLQISDGRMVTTALHNLYVQLYYQTGIVGLLLYLAFVLTSFRRLRSVLHDAPTRFEAAPSAVALCVLIGASIFYMAYTLDVFAWLFVATGLALSEPSSVRALPAERIQSRRSSV